MKPTLGAIILLSITALMAGCNSSPKQTSVPFKDDMDPKANPGLDFYRYANGGWLDRVEIPADKARYSAFDELNDATQEKVKSILERANSKQCDTTNADWMLIGDFYASGLDTAARNAQGLTPLDEDLNMIQTLTTPESIVQELARQTPQGLGSPFAIYVDQDSKEATQMVLSIAQSGLGMPDRDYYFDTTARAQALRTAYVAMLEKLAILKGQSAEQAAETAKKVMEFETRLAGKSLTRLEYRDPHRTYNKLFMKELTALTPNLDWALYFQNLGVENLPEYVIVDNPEFLKHVSSELKATPVDTWKEYLAMHVLIGASGFLSSELEAITFDFYGKALSGQKEMLPLWKRVASTLQRYIGEGIGKIYVEENFPPEAKERMRTMVEDLRVALAQHIKKLEWMGDATKEKALEKLNAIVVKVGYPDKWKNYAELPVARDSYAMNVRSGQMFHFNEMMAKLGKPVDRTVWYMTPQTVNAYYSPTMNEIVFPAGILQHPFFDMSADDPVNYGAIGVVIAHEITHGFDDQGRQYNKDGNLENWWTEEDAKRFEEESKLLVTQFDAFEPLPGEHINGSLTLGENLADYGGLTIACTALQNRMAEMEKAGTPLESIEGFTPLQRFFLGYARVWRNKIRNEELSRRLKEDVHSPGEYRVNGAVYNINAFYDAFPVDTNSPFYRAPEQRPSIW